MNLSKYVNVFFSLGLILLLLALFVVYSSFYGVSNAAVAATQTVTVEREMSVEQAQALIKKGEKLETIPNSTWAKILTPTQYRILWEKGTERAFTGELLKIKKPGVYVTAGCELPVFSSEHKFESGTGWPSFWDVINKDNVVLKDDNSWGMRRIEVLSKCGEHLGHVFKDGPEPTGLRYCINSAALKFIPAE